MANESIGKGKGGGESIPAILAASPKPKRSAKASAAKVIDTAIAPAVDPAPPIVSAPTVSAPVAQPTPAPAMAPAPLAIADPVLLPPAVALAPVVPNPPAAVPADTAKEINMATTIENVAQTTTDKAQAMFAETSERAKGAMAKSAKVVEELNAFGKGNVEAIVESSKIAAKGFEALGQDAAEFTRKSFEDATAAFKTLASVKSPTEFMKLQSDFMRSAFDALVAESSRSTETMLKLVGEVAQPISNRMSVAADKMKVAA